MIISTYLGSKCGPNFSLGPEMRNSRGVASVKLYNNNTTISGLDLEAAVEARSPQKKLPSV